MENLQIVQCNLQICQIGRLDGTDIHTDRNLNTLCRTDFFFERVVVVNCIFDPFVKVDYL